MQLFDFVLEVQAAAPPVIVNETGDIWTILGTISGFLFNLVLVISIIMFLFAAFTYITSGGNAEKVQQAGKMMQYAVIGIVVALLASSFGPFIKSILTGGGGSPPPSNPPGTSV